MISGLPQDPDRGTTGTVEYLAPVVFGNTLGGVVLVTLVNYAQTSDERMEFGRVEELSRLSTREWLLGGLVGRSNVQTTDDEPRRGD